MEGIRIALVLGLVLIARTAIEQAPSVGPLNPKVISYVAHPGHTPSQDPSEDSHGELTATAGPMPKYIRSLP